MEDFEEQIRILKEYLGLELDETISDQIDEIVELHKEAQADIKYLEERVEELEPLEVYSRWAPMNNIRVDLQLERFYRILDQIPAEQLDDFMDSWDPDTIKQWNLKNLF